MENVFSNNALKYYERGLIVTPLKQKSKVPIMASWQDPSMYKNYDAVIERYASCNMGLLLGEASGVIAIDIDKDSAMDLVPPSPVRKKGFKGETRFFKYSGEKNFKNHGLGIELLSTGNQTVLPPSSHPQGPIYAWMTPDTLLDINVCDLPELPKDFCNFGIGSKEDAVITKSEGNRCNHGSHTKLSSMLVAAILNEDTPDMVVTSLIQYDTKINESVSYFECPTRGWKNADKTINAYDFVIDGFKRHLKNKKIKKVYSVQTPLVINLEKPAEGTYLRRPLPHLRGVGKIMFDHIYKNSTVQRSHYMFASVITTASVILGNKIKMGETLPNIYSIIIGESGSGKSSSLKFPVRLLTKAKLGNLLGDTAPASDTGIIQSLPTNRVRIDVIDEGDTLFQTILSKNLYGQKMASTYASLYSLAGETFSGKTVGMSKNDKNSSGNIGGCFSPYVSLLVGITPVGFTKHVTQGIIDSGFLARFLYFFDREKKRSTYKETKGSEIPREITDFVKLWREESIGTINLSKAPMDEFFIKEITVTPEANIALADAHTLLEDIKEREPLDSRIRSILERSFENLKKLAIVDCALVNSTTTDLVMSKESVTWALEFTLTHINNAREELNTHIVENIKAEKYKDMLAFIAHRKEITLTQFTSKFKNTFRALRTEILADLVESGDVRKYKKEDRTIYLSAN